MKINKGKTIVLLAGTVLTAMGLHTGTFRASGPVALSDFVKTETAVVDKPDSVVGEVIWVVGDEPILESEVEIMRLQSEVEDTKWNGDPECILPEQIAAQKLFLHQVALDSVGVNESETARGIDDQINYWISLPQIGSKEKLEAFQNKSMTQIRQDPHDDYKNHLLVQKVQQNLVNDMAVSPAEVREYFKKLSVDSIPMIPTTAGVEILTQTPKIETEEIDRIKNQLRGYTDRVTKGETSFTTLVHLYSEDPDSTRQGGGLGYMGRGILDPAFAVAAFNLTDPKKVSKVVESEFGYHIIQLIDRRGNKVNVCHILLKPNVSIASIDVAKERLDPIGKDVKSGKFTFEDATAYLSNDKDTRNNHGLMVSSIENSHTSRFRMKELPTEVARVVDTMKVGEVSMPFQMANARGRVVCAIVKLEARVPERRAMIIEDFQTIRDIVTAKRRKEVLHDWVVKKVKETYVRINSRYRSCNFQYEGWLR